VTGEGVTDLFCVGVAVLRKALKELNGVLTGFTGRGDATSSSAL